MHRSSLRTLAVASLALLLPLSGCDETGDLTGGSVDQQVDNARAARQSGDFDTAVQILEAAYAANPDNAPVRAEYSVTLLERDGINLLDLDRAATFITSVSGGGVKAPTDLPAAARSTCTFSNDPSATEFSLSSYAGFPELQANRETIRTVLALLDPIIPESIQNFDLCTSIVDGPDGPVLSYSAQAALAEMRALGLDDAQISAVLASNALSRFLNAYLFLTLDLPQQTTWYRTNNGSSIGVCADDPDALLDQAEQAVADLGEAALSIDLRAATYGSSSTSQEIVELVIDGYTEIRDGIGDYCSN